MLSVVLAFDRHLPDTPRPKEPSSATFRRACCRPPRSSSPNGPSISGIGPVCRGQEVRDPMTEPVAMDEAAIDKIYAAEHHIAAIRLGIVLFNSTSRRRARGGG